MCLSPTKHFLNSPPPERTIVYKVVKNTCRNYCSPLVDRPLIFRLGEETVALKKINLLFFDYYFASRKRFLKSKLHLYKIEDGVIHVANTLEVAKRLKGAWSTSPSSLAILKCEVDPKDWIADEERECGDISAYLKIKPIEVVK